MSLNASRTRLGALTKELIVHWHLSPDSDAVRDKINYVLRRPATDPHTEVEVVEPK